MNKLPPEILAIIFRYLYLKQKLECMLVCHTSVHILRDGYLLETVELSVASRCQSFHNKFDYLAKMAKAGFRKM